MSKTECPACGDEVAKLYNSGEKYPSRVCAFCAGLECETCGTFRNRRLADTCTTCDYNKANPLKITVVFEGATDTRGARYQARATYKGARRVRSVSCDYAQSRQRNATDAAEALSAALNYTTVTEQATAAAAAYEFTAVA